MSPSNTTASASVRTLTPSGVFKDAAGNETPLRATVVRRVMEGWAIRREIEALEERLKALQNKLKEDFQSDGGSISLIVPGVCRLSIAQRESVRITDPDRLQAVLGAGTFQSLVRAEVAYKPEPRLIEMSADADDPLAPAIRACLSVGASTACTWRTEK